jgi:GNAT superfamily N-acetyltransferase
MSFWTTNPGPTWWDCIESLNPCHAPPYGLCKREFLQPHPRPPLPAGCSVISLSSRHAAILEKFLRQHYSIYPRCRISLSKERIAFGLTRDKWIGVALINKDKELLGCCFSKPLGRMKFPHETLSDGGVVDYFCVHSDYRKQGVAQRLLQDLVFLTANIGRLVHVFEKEGFPLLSLPPLYTSRYIAREKQSPGPTKEWLGSMGIGLHGPIQEYSHSDFLPLTKFVANLPYELNGDSELFGFQYKGHSVFLCMTDIHHRTVPEGKRIGELAWMLPKTVEVPLAIQKIAVETCVDCSKFDVVLMDKTIPHDSRKPWAQDASFSWYIFNYNPGGFFSTKPFWIV